MPWTAEIRARWAHEKRYILPTRAQMETLVRFTLAITEVCAGNLQIPRDFPGLSKDGKKFCMGRVGWTQKGQWAAEGIIAHGYDEHADGFFPVLYCYLVIGLGYGYADGYDAAVDIATGAGAWGSLPET